MISESEVSKEEPQDQVKSLQSSFIVCILVKSVYSHTLCIRQSKSFFQPVSSCLLVRRLKTSLKDPNLLNQ